MAMTSHQREFGNAASPRHIAIIMDGNGRWAKQRHLPCKMGHQHGMEALKKLLDESESLGIDYLTVYAFSSENWHRPAEEVQDLLGLLRYYLQHEIRRLHEKQVRLRFIGDHSRFSDDIKILIQEAEQLTINNQNMALIVALSYGSRHELVRAAQVLAQKVTDHELAVQEIDEAAISTALDMSGIPDPDLLIRTGGEQRLSNFLLWQCAYAELYFTDTYWPDFTIEHLRAAINDYASRERRFGRRCA